MAKSGNKSFRYWKTHIKEYTIVCFHLNNTNKKKKNPRNKTNKKTASLKVRMVFTYEVWEWLRGGKSFLCEIIHASGFKLQSIMAFSFTIRDACPDFRIQLFSGISLAKCKTPFTKNNYHYKICIICWMSGVLFSHLHLYSLLEQSELLNIIPPLKSRVHNFYSFLLILWLPDSN